MLVVTIRVGEHATISVPGRGECVIHAVAANHHGCRVGFECPKDWQICRSDAKDQRPRNHKAESK